MLALTFQLVMSKNYKTVRMNCLTTTLWLKRYGSDFQGIIIHTGHTIVSVNFSGLGHPSITLYFLKRCQLSKSF